MQTHAFVDKPSLLSTNALSMVYVVLGASLVSFVNELFTNVDRQNQMKRARLTHIVTFRLDSEQWQQLQSVSQAAREKPNDWVRDLTIQTLANGLGLKPSERFVLEQFAAAQYLVTHGFQLLAENNLTTEEWKKIRAIANERTSEIADVALTMRAKRSGQRSK